MGVGRPPRCPADQVRVRRRRGGRSVFERLALAADLTAWLGARGLPVSAPVPTPDGRVQVRTDDVSMSLQRVVDGAHLDVDDPEQVHAVGAAIARLHRAMVAYPGTAGRHGVLTPPPAPAELVAGWLDTAPEAALPLQVVQGDYRAANVLCADDRVVAVLDFEELRLDHRVVELARSAVMLGTLFHDWGPVSEAVRQRFLDGYRSVETLTRDELRWWDVLVLWYSLALVPPGDDPTGWGRAADEHLARIRSR
ncbi:MULTISPECIES: phosphotransferase [unclassified Curtobacterium]|uniref:phosphotransferase n=1 Tax=unclassified Curtobacterium TaxID=257496 RepID=UPI0038110360